jgi:hypothetical protein
MGDLEAVRAGVLDHVVALQRGRKKAWIFFLRWGCDGVTGVPHPRDPIESSTEPTVSALSHTHLDGRVRHACQAVTGMACLKVRI